MSAIGHFLAFLSARSFVLLAQPLEVDSGSDEDGGVEAVGTATTSPGPTTRATRTAGSDVGGA